MMGRKCVLALNTYLEEHRKGGGFGRGGGWGWGRSRGLKEESTYLPSMGIKQQNEIFQ